MEDVHEELRKAGVELDHHQSDLYAKVTPVSKEIVRRYRFRDNVRKFISRVDGTLWYNIPFAYVPFWDRVRAARELVRVAKSLVAVKVGDVCKVDMAVVKAGDATRGAGLGHWVRVVRDTVRMGGGTVKVLEVRGKDAEVAADSPMGGVAGSVTVPVRALRLA